MTSRVTLNVFSGKQNPSWLLSEKQEAELTERLATHNDVTTKRPTGSFSGLGYRGFTVSRETSHPSGRASMLIHEGIADQHFDGPNLIVGPELEQWLLRIAPESLSELVTDHVKQSLSEASFLLPTAAASACPPCHAADAPLYNPGAWNNPSVQPHNNCYNYANDQITNTFAQPGRGNGHMYTAMTCQSVEPAARSDGLATAPNFAGPLPAGHGWYVALVIWPNSDFHWYRQDKPGCWSHKPGSTAVRDVDNAGKKIMDPKVCNRGPYTVFCNYMISKRGVHIR